MVRVKICGLTRLEDAAASLEYGADYLGFIFYPSSPRAVAAEDVLWIANELRSSMKDRFAGGNTPRLVGVFVNENAGTIRELLDYCGLDLAQLSGDEDPATIVNPLSPLYGRAYKAIRPNTTSEALNLIDRYTNIHASPSPLCPSILLDTPHGKLYGGTGEVGNWELAAEMAAIDPRLMLAGGLTAENVTEAVGKVRPCAVDVAGGVEERPGIKNHDLLRSFIQNAKGISAAIQ